MQLSMYSNLKPIFTTNETIYVYLKMDFVFSFSTSNIFIRVVVAISSDLITISSAIGWCYFVAWSVSFYPQIYINYVRKSVVGLNFDFLSLNIVGFVLYGLFNIGMYSIPEIQVI